MLKFLLIACLGTAWADLRRAAQPKQAWKTQQRNRNVPFQTKWSLYIEPSDFGYEGLKNQRDGGAYDNFLRSNIDNEQDRRNFNTEDGKDHLPFRTYETGANDAGEPSIKHRMVPATAAATDNTEAGNYLPVTPGVPRTVALRWNNPHSSELEINLWVMNKGPLPFVIPIKRPTCSGEGYQDNAFTYTIPTDFNQVASCRKVGECVLQIYSHSVESRMYASGTPIIVAGGDGTWAPGKNAIAAGMQKGGIPARNAAGVFDAELDRAWDLQSLRRLCLPSSAGAAANWQKTFVYKARLSSDVYNHAYQNSDFSPYAGQQPQFISQNMQASCILKMAVGNFGELGKEYMHKTAREARDYAGKLDKKARGLVRNYETVTNSIIEAIKTKEKEETVMEAVAAPLGSVICEKWTDQYNNRAYKGLGRERGIDRRGGYCAEGYTCLCHHDCWGEHRGKEDAYCAKLEDALDRDVPIKKMVEGSEVPRLGYAAQKTEVCFRCPEAGSTVVRRINTNTYIPSFEIHGGDSVNMALQYVAPMMLKSGFLTNPNTGLISKKGDDRAILQIYMAVLTDMWPEFKMASSGAYIEAKYPHTWKKIQENPQALDKYKFTYRGPVLKTTTATLSDANGGVNYAYRKMNEEGEQDKGYYSAKKAWVLQNRATGSSTEQPDTAGPLKAQLSPQSAHNDGLQSPCEDPLAGTCTQASAMIQIPPPLEVEGVDNCFAPALLAQSDSILQDISPLGLDMDALNYDADCDDDKKIKEHQDEQDELCEAARLQDELYECPPYTELECVIPGQTGIKPGQMFTNDEEVSWMNSAESSGPSVTFFLAVVSAFFYLF